jgi:hypothetical protein
MSQEGARPAGPRWEYRIERFVDFGDIGDQERRASITGQLDEWGQEGWELVSVVVGPAGAARQRYALVFKRPAPAPPFQAQVF